MIAGSSVTTPSRLGPRPLRVEPCHGAGADVLPGGKLCLRSGGDGINSSLSGLLWSWKQRGVLASAPPHRKLSDRDMRGASDSFQAAVIGTWPVPPQGPGRTDWAEVDRAAGGLGRGRGHSSLVRPACEGFVRQKKDGGLQEAWSRPGGPNPRHTCPSAVNRSVFFPENLRLLSSGVQGTASLGPQNLSCAQKRVGGGAAAVGFTLLSPQLDVGAIEWASGLASVSTAFSLQARAAQTRTALTVVLGLCRAEKCLSRTKTTVPFSFTGSSIFMVGPFLSVLPFALIILFFKPQVSLRAPPVCTISV